MCPVRSVTYVSGRSKINRAGLFAFGASYRREAPEQRRLGLGSQTVTFRHLDDIAVGNACVPPVSQESLGVTRVVKP